jgi:hypothetical protein
MYIMVSLLTDASGPSRNITTRNLIACGSIMVSSMIWALDASIRKRPDCKSKDSENVQVYFWEEVNLM